MAGRREAEDVLAAVDRILDRGARGILSDVGLQLPIAFAPANVREAGLSEAPTRPHVSDGKGPDGRQRYQRPRQAEPAEAWGWAEIEMRTPTAFPLIQLDVDGDDSRARIEDAVRSGKACRPSMIVSRRDGGRGSHVLYFLKRPVLRSGSARLAPLEMLERAAEWHAHALGADASYANHAALLAHNPAHARWDTTSYGSGYSLRQLLAPIPKGWRLPPATHLRTDIGRNVALFKACIRFARDNYQDAAFALQDLEAFAQARRLGVAERIGGDHPFTSAEASGIARSVWRYVERQWRPGIVSPRWSARQSVRGRRRGARKAERIRARNADRDAAILSALASGLSERKTAARFGVSRGLVAHIKRRPLGGGSSTHTG